MSLILYRRCHYYRLKDTLTVQIPQNVHEINWLIERTIRKVWVCQTKSISFICDASHVSVSVAIIQIDSTEIVELLLKILFYLNFHIQFCLANVKRGRRD